MDSTLTINEIVEYIIKTVPDGYFSQMVVACPEWRDNESVMVEKLIDEFYYSLLHWCGCGNPDVAKAEIRKYLRYLETIHEDDGGEISETTQKEYGIKHIYDNPLLLCLAYAMDAARFTEHGTSIGGAWLTREGEMFLFLLEKEVENV
jgi:hypothetical protein